MQPMGTARWFLSAVRLQNALLLGAGDWNRPATFRLRISTSPTSDTLRPQETTKLDAPDIGLEGADLSCPGSSAVADEDVKADGLIYLSRFPRA
jgi:hypothetical protein